ncbi:YciI family protein [Micromonospora coxensis]|uniref:YciI family protein n=1 Tax=Micromonospora coxensis TaxID=356852 RepID=UPI0034164E1C
MFVVTLTYLVDLARIDEALEDHIAWLDQQYADGVFIASGRRVPRVGGVILAGHLTRDDLECRLASDPFRQRGLAEYTVTEFVPTRAAEGFADLLP